MEVEAADNINAMDGARQKKSAPRRNSATAANKTRKPASLACLNCRPRKIRCQRVNGSCERCRALGVPCQVPDRDERKLRYSKEYIEGLENEIAELREALQQSRSSEVAVSTSPELPREHPNLTVVDIHPSNQPTLQPSPPSSNGDTDRASSEGLIERLCGMKGRLNGGSDGHMRYFGPTSSLHLTESVSSISSYSNDVSNHEIRLDKGVPEALQYYLLDLYWTYQHSVLPVVHKEAFLDGFSTGKGPYYSQCLLLCILASGARISARPQIRELVIPTEDLSDGDTQRRPLAKMAVDALEKELLNPMMTTVQSLMLMSILDCCQSNDSLGWMRSGNACRLVFDLGLNQDWSFISAPKLSRTDLEVRQVIFWGCFGLDRLWALYLGRPPFIKLTDVSIRRPDRDAPSWDLRIFAVWVELLDLAGQIGDKLNASSCSQPQIDIFSNALDVWLSSLEPSLTFTPDASPAVYHLHMQYSAVRILLNRHNAGFGNPDRRAITKAITSRDECVRHACRIAGLVQDYKTHHGEAYTMIGSALYNTTMAATTLVAEIAEKRKDDTCEEWGCLMACLRTMKELESTEIVARNVYRIVQTIMKVCNVRETSLDVGPISISSPALDPQLITGSSDGVLFDQGQTTLAMWPASEFDSMDMSAFSVDFGQTIGQSMMDSDSASFLASLEPGF